MPRNLYIADLHFGDEEVIKKDGRPFASQYEMEDTLISNWNNAVTSEDTVYIVGDFSHDSEAEWKRLLFRLAGNKVLIRGNHDPEEYSKSLRSMLDEITDYKEIVDKGRRVILSHYPMMFYKSATRDPDTYMLCGHVHVTAENGLLVRWRDELRNPNRGSDASYGNIINVGCMLPYMDYTPRTLDDLINPDCTCC